MNPKTKLALVVGGVVVVVVVVLVLLLRPRGDFTFGPTLPGISIPQGRSGTTKISFTRTGGFAGEVTFALTGTPSGVTAKLDPVKTDKKGSETTLTLTVGPGVAVGKNVLKVTATSGRLKKEATLELTVLVAPDYSFDPAPTPVTIRQGASGTVTINLKRTETFRAAGDTVALTLEGAPAGVTGTFSPATVAGPTDRSTLTLSVGAAAVPGTYRMTVRGKATGLADKTATVTLTVEAAPDFSLALAPTTVTVKAGETGTVRITITRVGGLADPVSFEVTGLPTGVTAEFDPQPAPAGASSLTLNVGGAAAPGTYILTVRGVAAAISKTATLSLTIAAP